MILLVFTTSELVRAETNSPWQTITLPCSADISRFVDLDGNGGRELLVVDAVARKLLIYRQRSSGFTNTPDQTLVLPDRTAWIAPADVDSEPGLELVVSAGSGISYYVHSGGSFGLQPRELIPFAQVFGPDVRPRLVDLNVNSGIPLVSPLQTAVYYRRQNGKWKPGGDIALAGESSLGWARSGWSVGGELAATVVIKESHCARADEPQDPIQENMDRWELSYPRADRQHAENEGISDLIKELEKGKRWEPGMIRVDLNRDGRIDLVLWIVSGEADKRTDVYVFLRGTDGKLPERPSQILHCRGFPIPVGSPHVISPLADLKGDGKWQLVLLELKSSVTSVNGMLEMALSRGLDWSFAIRRFENNGFSTSPDSTAEVRAIFPSERLSRWPVFVCGDFNGDGRPDFVVQRSNKQWNIYFSSKDEHWFSRQPDLTFETPMYGYFTMEDVDGDGRSDIILRAKNDPRIHILHGSTIAAAAANPAKKK